MEATYIRISTITQQTSIQDVRAVGEKYVDKITGITPFKERPNGGRLLADIAIGKIKHVFVNRIDRLGRNAQDIMDTIEFFKAHKCQLTVTSMGNLSLFEDGKINYAFMMSISLYSQIAEQQKEELKEKTQEGINIARKKGKFRGRKQGTRERKDYFLSKHKDIINCLENGMSLNKTQETTQKSKPTIIKVKKLISE
jgi:DNA invertase Pin-like site-specific DNA recombinase